MFEADNEQPELATEQTTLLQGTDLLLEGFTACEVSHLLESREKYLNGSLCEFIVDHKRLGFVHWLRQHGHIAG